MERERLSFVGTEGGPAAASHQARRLCPGRGVTLSCTALVGTPAGPLPSGLALLWVESPPAPQEATHLQQGLVCREVDAAPRLQGAAVLPPAQHGRGHGSALALQGHGLVGHDGHVQLFPEDAWGRCGRGAGEESQAGAQGQPQGVGSQL